MLRRSTRTPKPNMKYAGSVPVLNRVSQTSKVTGNLVNQITQKHSQFDFDVVGFERLEGQINGREKVDVVNEIQKEGTTAPVSGGKLGNQPVSGIGNRVDVEVTGITSLEMEMRVDGTFRDRVILLKPSDTVGEYCGSCHIDIEYEWRPPVCAKCDAFGHTTEKCPRAAPENKPRPVIRYEPKKNNQKITVASSGNPLNKDWSVVVAKRRNHGMYESASTRAEGVGRETKAPSVLVCSSL